MDGAPQQIEGKNNDKVKDPALTNGRLGLMGTLKIVCATNVCVGHQWLTDRSLASRFECDTSPMGMRWSRTESGCRLPCQIQDLWSVHCQAELADVAGLLLRG